MLVLHDIPLKELMDNAGDQVHISISEYERIEISRDMFKIIRRARGKL